MLKNNSIVCPYCDTTYSLFSQIDCNTGHTVGTKNVFYFNYDRFDYHQVPTSRDEAFRIFMTKCPHCENYTLKIDRIINIIDSTRFIVDNTNVNTQILPMSIHTHFPDYIPQNIRNDYEEACAILSFSPKAAATLARRCLQGMIRDFWGITKRTLYEEIDSLKELIPIAQWSAIDALRKIGNIGAHMEKDVNIMVDIEKEEAEKLIKFIEYLIKQWYVERHEREKLMAGIVDIADTIKS